VGSIVDDRPAAERLAAHQRIYDSDVSGTSLAQQLRETWSLRRLLRVLVARDVVIRYKRSLLGIWWTLLNPLARMVVMWAVLSAVFHPQAIGVPYAVYLLSGLIVVTFFEQAVLTAGSSIVNASGVLSKVHVPPQVFAFSAVLAAAVTLLFSLGVLLGIQLLTGVGIRPTAVLLPIPLIALLMLATGVGLLVAAVAVRLHDVLDLMVVILQLTAFVTPTFYPLASVSDRFRTIIELNPLTQVVSLVRALSYDGTLPGLATWLYAVGTGLAILLLGVVVLARTWRTSAAML
jgi:ABC-type polysaccharide/polyol phosphate export permease